MDGSKLGVDHLYGVQEHVIRNYFSGVIYGIHLNTSHRSVTLLPSSSSLFLPMHGS